MPKGVYKRKKGTNVGKYNRTEKLKEFLRNLNVGRKFPKEKYPKYSLSKIGNKNRKGIPHSQETRKKISNSLRGDKSPNWKGGINDINDTIIIW